MQAGRTASVGDGPTRHLLLLARDDQRHMAIFEASAGGAVARQGWEGVVASPQCPFDLRAEAVWEPGLGLVGVVRNAGPAPSLPGTARWLAGGRRWAESHVPALAAGETLELVVPTQQVAEMVREVQAGRRPPPAPRRERRPLPLANLPAGARVVLLAPLPAGDLNPRDNAFELFVGAALAGVP